MAAAVAEAMMEVAMLRTVEGASRARASEEASSTAGSRLSMPWGGCIWGYRSKWFRSRGGEGESGDVSDWKGTSVARREVTGRDEERPL